MLAPAQRAASRAPTGHEALRIAVSPSLLAPAEVAVRTLYSADTADTWAWGFRASSPVAQLTFSNPGIQEDAACGPLLDAVAIKELPTPYPTKDNLIKNDGFEIGPQVFKNSSVGVLLPPKQKDTTPPLPGWIIESLKAVRYIDAAHFASPIGHPARRPGLQAQHLLSLLRPPRPAPPVPPLIRPSTPRSAALLLHNQAHEDMCRAPLHD